MIQKHIDITYSEFRSADEMIPEDRELVGAAIEAMSGAYAPYSHFHVGAAVRLSNGQIVKGSNQENAAFPSGLCAERTAMFAASSRYPDKDMLSIAIAGGVLGMLGTSPATPCGACRQVLYEFGPDMEVVCLNKDNEEKHLHIKELLPYGFDQTWLAIDEK